MRFTNSVCNVRVPGWAQLLCVCVVLLLPLPSVAQDSLQALLQRLSTQGELQIAGARVIDLPVTQEFYASAPYAPASTNALAVDELADSIEQAWREGMNPEDYHQHQVQGLHGIINGSDFHHPSLGN